MSRYNMFDADDTADYPLAFNTSAQIEAYAEAYADRLAYEAGCAPEMHIREPLKGKATRRPARAISLPPVVFPKPPKLPRPVVLPQLPPVPAHLDLGGRFDVF